MKRLCAIGVLLAGAVVGSAQVLIYDTLGSPPYVRPDTNPVTIASACCTWSALATRFTVSSTVTLTGFDLALRTNTSSNTVTVSIYKDSIGVPGNGSLGAAIATATFVNIQPACVPGFVFFPVTPDSCVLIFSGTIPGNVLLTAGNYWLAVSGGADWERTANGEGIAYQDPTTQLWTSLADNPWGIRVYGACPTAPADAVAQYKFENVSGPIKDEKNGLDGAIKTIQYLSNYNPGGTLNSIPGESGKGVNFPNVPTVPGNFPSSPAVIMLPNDPRFDSVTNDISIFAYVKFDPNVPPAVSQTIFGRFGNSKSLPSRPANYAFTIRNDPGLLPEFDINDGNQGSNGYNSWIAYGLPISRDNQWHCVGVRLARQPNGTGKITFFVDGATENLYTSYTLGPLDPGASTWIGWNGFEPSNYDTFFNSSMDELQFFQRGLSDAEMNALCGICGPNPIAPPAPAITSPTTGFNQTSTSVTVTGTANANASIAIFDGAIQVGTGSANGSGAFSIGIMLAIGSHSLTATQTVNSIASAASTAVTGSIAPIAPAITSPTSGFSQIATSLTVAGTANANASITIFDGASQVGTGTANSSGNFSIVITLPIGLHSLTAKQTVSSVISAASNTVAGSIAPPAPTITSPASGFSQTSTSVIVAGTALANAAITIFDGVSQLGIGSANGSGNFSIVIALAIGNHSLTATQTVNSVTSAASNTVTGAIAPLAPTITSPANGFSRPPNTTLNVAGTALPNASITIYDNNSQIATGSADSTGHFSIGITLALGSHSLTATQTVNSITSAASNAVSGTIQTGTPPPAQSYQDSFENAYTFFNQGVGVVRVRQSGSTTEKDYAPGIAASDGSFYARLAVQPGNNINNAQTTVCSPGALGANSFSCVGPFSEWGLPYGGADGKFDTGVPISGPSQTSVDIYLDTKFASTAASSSMDYRFDWDSNLLDKKGNFLLDYVFNVAIAVPPEVSRCSNGFVIEASNNSQRSGGANAHNPAPPNPGQVCITRSGWYTFSHLFRKDPNGNLAVDMTISSIPGNTALAQWTLHPTCQSAQASAGLCSSGQPLPFSAVGYNFEGSFPNQEINDLAVDNIRKNP